MLKLYDYFRSLDYPLLYKFSSIQFKMNGPRPID